MIQDRPRGFTFVEMLFVVPIVFVLIGGILLVLADAGRNTWGFVEAQLEAETEAQRIVDRLTEDLRGARTAQCGVDGGGIETVSINLDADVAFEIVYALDPSLPGPYPGTQTLTRTAEAGAQVLSTKLTRLVPNPVPDCADGAVELAVTARARDVRGRFVDQPVTPTIWVPLS